VTKPSNTTKLYLLVGAIILANALDLASTYAVSPDLAGEWNILERQFGLGWPGLIGAKLVGCWIAAFGYAYYLRHRERCYGPAGADLGTFAHNITFGDGTKDAPSQWLLLGVNIGYFWAGIQMLVIWVALDNILLRYNIYCPLRHVSELGYHLLQSLVVGGAVFARFYYGNYARYRAISAPSTVVLGGLTKAGDCANLPAI